MHALLCPAVAILILAASPALAQEAAAPAPGSAAPAATAPGAAGSNTGGITLELNKLTQMENACHAYVIVGNQTPEQLKDLTVDVYLFDKADVILRGLALQFVDVRPGRQTVVPFELPDLNCGDISRVLLNKVLTCTNAAEAAMDRCGEMLTVSTRANARFEY